MVYTVTLNPALDMYLRPRKFAPGEVCRCESPEYVPGGKGINVSLMLKSLGAETTAAGITAGFTGRELQRLLEREGLRTSFTELETGLTRVNVKILPKARPETALNASGPNITLQDLEPLGESISALAPGDFLVLAGSIPPSLPGDVYARLMDRAPRGVRAIVDASGPALIEGARKRPFLVKPNLEELGEAFGTKLKGREDAIEYARRLRAMGPVNTAVTLGGDGALLLTEGGSIYELPPVPGREVSSVGAGDSFIAGFIYGLTLGEDLRGALAWAVCAGAATAFTRGIADGGAVKELHKAYLNRKLS